MRRFAALNTVLLSLTLTGCSAAAFWLSGRLARVSVDFTGERLYLTLDRGGDLTVTEEWPDGI